MGGSRAALVCLVGACFPALACAPVPPDGAVVHIAQEEAIILWDGAAKTQHFIRRATFDTSAKDFGFLVPTQSRPQLAQADDWAFEKLSGITAPRVVRRTSWWELLFPEDTRRAKRAAAAPVTVLERVTVGGYDAAVLEATDAGALDSWLKAHGYMSNPDLVEWYKPYIAAKWKITAFKIASQGPAGVTTSAVRMSFAADRPFFPYREPASARTGEVTGKRLLRVFVLADARFEGILGTQGQWPGKTVWSGSIEERHRLELLMSAKIPPELVKGATWVTEFEDTSSPRPGTDEVFFRRASDQSTVKRPDVVTGTPLWGDLVSFAIVAGLLWLAFKILRWLFRKITR